jgi:hypothetical protein
MQNDITQPRKFQDSPLLKPKPILRIGISRFFESASADSSNWHRPARCPDVIQHKYAPMPFRGIDIGGHIAVMIKLSKPPRLSAHASAPKPAWLFPAFALFPFRAP